MFLSELMLTSISNLAACSEGLIRKIWKDFIIVPSIETVLLIQAFEIIFIFFVLFIKNKIDFLDQCKVQFDI